MARERPRQTMPHEGKAVEANGDENVELRLCLKTRQISAHTVATRSSFRRSVRDL
jgi:hypothetical protein